MVKCQWSVDDVCQCFVTGDEKPLSCDGQHKMPCNQGNLDLVDIRFSQAKKNPGRGGRRVGAGAPRGNLNAIKSGTYSIQLKDAFLQQQLIIAKAREARARRIGKQQAGEER